MLAMLEQQLLLQDDTESNFRMLSQERAHVFICRTANWNFAFLNSHVSGQSLQTQATFLKPENEAQRRQNKKKIKNYQWHQRNFAYLCFNKAPPTMSL